MEASQGRRIVGGNQRKAQGLGMCPFVCRSGLCRLDKSLNLARANPFTSAWGHQGLCTTHQQWSNRGRPFEFILRATFIGHGDEGEAVPVEGLAKNLTSRANLPS